MSVQPTSNCVNGIFAVLSSAGTRPAPPLAHPWRAKLWNNWMIHLPRSWRMAIWNWCFEDIVEHAVSQLRRQQ